MDAAVKLQLLGRGGKGSRGKALVRRRTRMCPSSSVCCCTQIPCGFEECEAKCCFSLHQDVLLHVLRRAAFQITRTKSDTSSSVRSAPMFVNAKRKSASVMKPFPKSMIRWHTVDMTIFSNFLFKLIALLRYMRAHDFAPFYSVVSIPAFHFPVLFCIPTSPTSLRVA